MTQQQKKVEIQGLAIYAQDAVKYTYYIAEENDLADKHKMNAYSFSVFPPSGEEMSEQGEDPNKVVKAEFTLTNTLKAFDLVVNKEFYKTFLNGTSNESGDEQISRVKIAQNEYEQYFNSDYVAQLRFNLYRSTESAFEPNEDTLYKSNLKFENGTTYSLTVKDIPKYDPYGNEYYYRLVEDEDKKGDKVVKKDPDELDASTVSGTSQSVTVENTFPAKRIRVDKFWDDSDNIDGMRPTKLDYTITETVPDIDAPININKTLENSKGWTMTVELPKYYYNGNVKTEVSLPNVKL